MGLLPFQHDLVTQIHDPEAKELVIIARGLGLRKVVCTLLEIYDGPKNLVLLVNAGVEEEQGIGSELGTMGVRNPGLRVVDYEMSKKDRQALYLGGGLISVTSRILVVDLLTKDIPVELITGMIILHAEKVTPTSTESFIVRLYRDSNHKGFLKAFSDQPEQFTQGMFVLKDVMKELQIRHVHLLPRFAEPVQNSLERRKADVVELYVPLSQNMTDIHNSIIECITATLKQLKSNNTTLELDLDALNVENSYFRSFDSIVRRHLDPVWHKVGPKTKQLVGDLGTLRRLLSSLLTLDPITFHSYLETIISTNSNSAAEVALNPLSKPEKSEWLYTDAAHVIISKAKARCYIHKPPKPKNPDEIAAQALQAEWDMMDEIERSLNETTSGDGSAAQNKQNSDAWIPEGITPTLEEPIKWGVLAQVLLEIEHEMINRPMRLMEPGTNTVLIMVHDQQTCSLLQNYLSSMHIDPTSPGKSMLRRRLKSYFYWKSRLADLDSTTKNPWKGRGKERQPTKVGHSGGDGQDGEVNEALKLKDQQRAQARAARRRVRGGGNVNVAGSDNVGGGTAEIPRKSKKLSEIIPGEMEMEAEAVAIAEHLSTQLITLDEGPSSPLLSAIDQQPLATIDDQDVLDLEFLGLDDNSYGLLEPEQVVLVRTYGEDGDDLVLAELRPRWIIMYEPNLDFVRRIEVYKSSNPGLAVRVYLMLYMSTAEEQKYLVTLRREKDAFAHLIKEKGSMVMITPESSRSRGLSERPLAILSTRIGGGARNPVSDETPTVIVDMREFRSSLPNLIDKARMKVVPATLTVGDYILTPDICVERKSVPDLVQSFISGRLYTQCELMSAHYRHPVLLIEFEDSKSFSLQTIAEARPGPKKDKAAPGPARASTANDSLIQSKLVLLTLAFPRLRIIWSPSPHTSATIFNDLKLNSPEPDVEKAASVGMEDGTVGSNAQLGEVNTLAEDVLRCLPGVGVKNLKYVMGRVGSVRDLSELSLKEVQELLGVEPGKTCFEFIHYGARNVGPIKRSMG